MPVPVSTTSVSWRRHVHVVGPTSAADLTLPGDRTVGDLVPAIVDLLGAESATTGRGTAWVLRRETGALVPGNVTVATTDIVDGDVLRLEYWDPGLPEPTVEDVPAELAAATTGLVDRFPARVLVPAWGVVLAWAVSGWLLVLAAGVVGAPGTGPARLASCAGVLAVAVTVGTAVRGWRGRADRPPAPATWEVLAALPFWALTGVLSAPAGVLPTAALGATALGVGALVLLGATRGRSRIALGAAAFAVPWAIVAGVGVAVDLRVTAVAAVLAGLVTLVFPLAHLAVASGVRVPAEPAPADIAEVAAAATGRVAALHAGWAAAAVAAWPVLLVAGGTATVLGIFSASALALALVGRHEGPDTTVTTLAGLAGVTALIATATAELTRSWGPTIGVLCPVLAVVVTARAARLRPGRRAAVRQRLATLQVAVHVAVPALLVATLGGYGVVHDLAARVA